MPYTKPLPEWKNAGTKPPQSKIDSGWAIGDKPPAGWWNWWMYNTYYALQELQTNAVHTEKLGTASGVATLGADSKLTDSQLPAIGSAQITDGSITNTDLATDVKVGSLTTLTTTAKGSVTAAINEVKTSDDLKIPLSQKAAASGVATLDATTKVPVAQIPVLPTANHADGSITDAKLTMDNKVGSLASLVTTAKGSAVAAINEVDADLSSHLNDAIRHITSGERTRWDAAQLFALTNINGSSKATTNADLNQTIATGFYNVLSGDLNGQGTAGHMIILNRGSTANVLQILYTLNQKLYTRQTSDSGATWTTWIEQETTAGAQSKVDTHAADTVKHITAGERSTWNAKASTAVATTTTNGMQSAADKAKLDGIAAGAQTNQNAFSNVKVGTTTIVADNATDVLEIVAGANIGLTPDATNDKLTITNTTPDATTSASGNMSSADKTKLDGVSTGANKVLNTINNGEISIDGVVAQVYNHPTTHPATMIVEDSTHRFVTDTEKATFNAKETPAGAQAKANTAEANAEAASVPRNDTRANTIDLNTYTTTGVFAIGTGVINGPVGYSNGNLMVTASAMDRITQVAFSPGQSKLYVRYGASGPLVWSAWDTLATTAAASGSGAGLMSAADFTKLAGIATGANNYVHPIGDGNSHVPATGTTNAGKFLKAAATANSASWQLIDWNDVNNKPSTFAPSAHGHLIAEVTGLQAVLDGKSATTHTHADATTSASGFQSAADKTKLNGISTGANKTTNNGTNGSISIDGTAITVYTHPPTHDAAIIVESATKRFVTDTEKATWNAKASTALATASANGLMSGSDFSKLAGISAGANKVTNPATNGVIAIDGTNTTVYAHPTGDGNNHVPATGTTNNGKYLVAGSTAGSAAWKKIDITEIESIQSGRSAITPVANVPTARTITFAKPFATVPNVLATADTTAPGSNVLTVSVSGVSETGFTLWVYRNGTSPTGIYWFAVAE